KALEQVVGDDGVSSQDGALDDLGRRASDRLEKSLPGGVEVDLPEPRASEQQAVRRIDDGSRTRERPRSPGEANGRTRRAEDQSRCELPRDDGDDGDGKHAAGTGRIGTRTSGHRGRTCYHMEPEAALRSPRPRDTPGNPTVRSGTAGEPRTKGTGGRAPPKHPHQPRPSTP